jgi:hypothetical protein
MPSLSTTHYNTLKLSTHGSATTPSSSLISSLPQKTSSDYQDTSSHEQRNIQRLVSIALAQGIQRGHSPIPQKI